VPQHNLDWHLESCRPYCDSCYQQEVVQRYRAAKLKWKPHCRCEPVPAQNLNELIWDRRESFAKIPQFKTLCRNCVELPSDLMLKRRRKRTRSELRHGLTVSGEKWTKCGRPGCVRELSTAGPRWWVCGNSKCRRECTSLNHDAWFRSEPSEVSTKVPWYFRRYYSIFARRQTQVHEAV
jgi:hypothetical protein